MARHGLILSEDGATAFRKPLGALLDHSDVIFAWILMKNMPKPGTTKNRQKRRKKLKNPDWQAECTCRCMDVMLKARASCDCFRRTSLTAAKVRS